MKKKILCNCVSSEIEAKKLLNFSIKFSYELLSSGAEVYRVEDSINRICRSFRNIKAVNVFAIDNMVIITFVYDGTNYTSMRRVDESDADLTKITLLNELSRNIVDGNCNIDKAFKKLKDIKNTKSYKNYIKIILLTISAPFLCFIFGGTIKDFFTAAVTLTFEIIFMLYIERFSLPSLLNVSLCSSAVTLFTVILSKIIYIEKIPSIIVAGIIILFPGMKITNAMRDVLSGDILSGIIGITKATLSALSIAVGVVIILKFLG